MIFKSVVFVCYIQLQYVVLQERLLKPLSGFSGISGEMKELASIISRVNKYYTHLNIYIGFVLIFLK